MHQAYLSLGSNIQPEVNLPKAIELLREYGEILKGSNAWESESVGSDGPNFLNACVLFLTPLLYAELKDQVIHPIEAKLGRKRSKDKYAPRTIDIDIVLFDDQLCDDKFWKQAFVVIPLAEIYPEYQRSTPRSGSVDQRSTIVPRAFGGSPVDQNRLTRENITEAAARIRQKVWMEPRPEVLSRFNGNSRESKS